MSDELREKTQDVCMLDDAADCQEDDCQDDDDRLPGESFEAYRERIGVQ